MDECIKCGKEGDKVRLFEGIGEDGIVKICEKCADEEDILLVKKPTTFQLKKAEQSEGSVYERLSKKTGFDPKNKGKTNFYQPKKSELNQQEVTLQKLIEKNIKINPTHSYKPRVGLTQNFHWIITRARRKKHMSLSQVAIAIGESEIAIKMIEQGTLPEDDFRLVNKLESFLGIRIRKPEQGFENKDTPARIVNFKPETLNKLTIADLKEMKQKSAPEIVKTDKIIETENKLELPPEDEKSRLFREVREKMVDRNQAPVEKNNKEGEDISQDKINDIIFGSKKR